MSDYRFVKILADFCNTLDERVPADHAAPVDHIATGRQLRDWLSLHDLTTEEQVSPAEVRLAHDLRAGLRLAIDPIDPLAAGKGRVLLRQAGQGCPLAITFDEQAEAWLTPAADGARGGLARLLIAILQAQQDESWSRLKMCSAADCRWVFVDHSRPGTGRWCKMRACGNRAKKRAYRERQKKGG